MTRPGFAFRFKKWIRVLAAGRLLLLQVGSRYLKALSSRQEDRELQKKEEMEMANQLLDYGDGGDWNGRSQQSVTASWQTDFEGSSSSVEFPITAGQSARIVAENLKNAWNCCYPYEASIDSYNEPATVRFDRNGKKPTGMAIKVGAGNSKPLQKDGARVQVDDKLDVGNVK